jgi:hypothetical protein
MDKERIQHLLTYCENLDDDERRHLIDELRGLSPIPHLVEELEGLIKPEAGDENAPVVAILYHQGECLLRETLPITTKGFIELVLAGGSFNFPPSAVGLVIDRFFITTKSGKTLVEQNVGRAHTVTGTAVHIDKSGSTDGPSKTLDEETYPICNGCGCEIINAMAPEHKPWVVVVRDPQGHEHEGGTFCLGCMIELAKHGLQLHDMTPDAKRPRSLDFTFERGSRTALRLNFLKKDLGPVASYCDQVFSDPGDEENLSLRFPIKR